jgi:DNA-binding NarL/FixJ family response regulator
MPRKKAKPKEEPKKVLIVDDEPDFVEAFRSTLQSKAYEVIITSSRSEAQETMKHDPDLIVLGTITPAGEAFRVHQWLKAHPRYKDTPLVVLDARYDERTLKGWRTFEGMQLQADEFLEKPVEPASLVPRISSLIEEAIRKIRVLVTDDHTMVRDGICAVLSLQKDIEIVGEAVSGQDALEKVLRLEPNVTLMDLMMPGMSGLEATRLIGKEYPQTKVLILTQYEEEENMLVAKQAGALGFIPKRAASSDLVTGIKTVYSGRFFPQGFSELAAASGS